MELLAGKTGLIIGIANERSYAWHMTRALMEHGAVCGFTHLPGERNEFRVRRSLGELKVSEPWLKPLDAGNDEQIASTIDQFGQDHGKIDFLVHSIAFADRDLLQPGKFITTSRSQYLAAIDISAYTLLAFARAAHPWMKKAGGGSIISMSYYGAEKVVPGYNVMGVAKSALESTSRYLASELGQDKIRVNCISGGYLRTLASSAVGGTEKMAEGMEKHAPLRRNVEGSDVGKTAVYLLSDLASGVTGETIYVDCGVNILGA